MICFWTFITTSPAKIPKCYYVLSMSATCLDYCISQVSFFPFVLSYLPSPLRKEICFFYISFVSHTAIYNISIYFIQKVTFICIILYCRKMYIILSDYRKKWQLQFQFLTQILNRSNLMIFSTWNAILPADHKISMIWEQICLVY